jgi:hypothetical protein
MRSFTNKVTFAAAALLTALAIPSLAQPVASGPDDTTQSASAPRPVTKAEERKQARAARRAERKAARAKNAAELKKLESNGYRPAVNDPNYPQDLQNAEKKANGAVGASQ